MTQPGGHRGVRSGAANPPVLRLLALLVGVLASAAAWFVLVRAAIDFGTEARDGRGAAWAFTGLASVGAIGCLLLAMVLVLRGLTLLGIVSESRGRSIGKHRG